MVKVWRTFYNQCAALNVVPELIDLQAANSYDERFDDLTIT